jgi:hypothetical protein
MADPKIVEISEEFTETTIKFVKSVKEFLKFANIRSDEEKNHKERLEEKSKYLLEYLEEYLETPRHYSDAGIW